MKYVMFTFISIAILASCSSDDEPTPLNTPPLPEPTVSVDPPANSMATSMGEFTSFAHGLSGKAVLYTGTANDRSLRLENFNMSAGPDVYVFLSRTNNYSTANSIPITTLEGSYGDANLTLSLADNVDLAEFKFVLVYCVEFSSLFGYAEPK